MRPEEKSFFVLLIYFISMTLLTMAVTAVWYPDVGLTVKSPITFLFGVGCAIALPITLCFLPFSRYASLAYVAEYCDAEGIRVRSSESSIGDDDSPKTDNDNYNSPYSSCYNKSIADDDAPFDAPGRIPINTPDNTFNNASDNYIHRRRNKNTTAVPYLIVVFSYVIFFCLNVLLLDAYLYTQQY